MPSEFRSRLGFTLIELLVASATMSLLAGLLVPALSGGRDVAIRQAELGNLRTLITLAHTYAARDPAHILGPLNPAANPFEGAGYADYGGGPGTMPYMNWNDKFGPRTRPFNQLLYGTDGLNTETAPGDRTVFKPFQCLGQDLGWQKIHGFPSDPRETESPYFKGNGTSFRMNNLRLGFHQFMGIYQRPVNRIPVPGLTIAFMEARALETIYTNEVWGTLDPLELTSYYTDPQYLDISDCPYLFSGGACQLRMGVT